MTYIASINELNYYQLLNISKNANRKDVEKVFRDLSLKWYPDRHRSPDTKKIGAIS